MFGLAGVLSRESGGNGTVPGGEVVVPVEPVADEVIDSLGINSTRCARCKGKTLLRKGNIGELDPGLIDVKILVRDVFVVSVVGCIVLSVKETRSGRGVTLADENGLSNHLVVFSS